MRRTLQVMLGAALALALAAALTGGWGQDASAARPSLQNLQVQINQLNALVNQLQGQVGTLQDLVDTLGPVLYVFDASGAEIGPLVSLHEEGVHRVIVYFATVDAIGFLSWTSGNFESGRSAVFFTEEGCTGEAFAHPDLPGYLYPVYTDPDGERLFISESAPSSNVEIRSEFSSNCTHYAVPEIRQVVPTTEVTRSDLGIPETLARPLRIGLSP